MCTVVLAIRPGHAVPVLLAANRDERVDRAWDGPGAHWPAWPGIVAGRDRTAGGTWMGMNRHGVAAMVLNRQGTLGPAAGKRSRGELPLLALAHATAAGAVAAMTALDAGEWRGFNMVIADAHGAVFLRGLGGGHPEPLPLPAGVHMVTAHEPNDPDSPRVARHLARFRAAVPDSAMAWESWRTILADKSGPDGTEINIPPRGGFGTVCSSLIAWPAAGAPAWQFAAGPPDAADFVAVEMHA
jgi:uncharacterized protein with NRDE domain